MSFYNISRSLLAILLIGCLAIILQRSFFLINSAFPITLKNDSARRINLVKPNGTSNKTARIAVDSIQAQNPENTLDVDFAGISVSAAIQAIQNISKSQGHSFDCDLSLIKESNDSLVTLHARHLSLDQALRTVLYLGGLGEIPKNDAGDIVVSPESTEYFQNNFRIKIEEQIFEFELDPSDPHRAERVRKILQTPSMAGLEREHATAVEKPTLMVPWSDKISSDHSEDAAVNVVLSKTAGHPAYAFEFHCASSVKDKTNINVIGRFILLDSDGKVLSGAEGQWNEETGTIVLLTCAGQQPLLSDEKLESPAKVAYFVLVKASLLDENENELIPFQGKEAEAALSKKTDTSR